MTVTQRHTNAQTGRVETAESGGIGWITLADPGRRNAIDLGMARELEDAVAKLENDPDVHALVVTGAGSAFCAGADRGVLADADQNTLHLLYEAFLAVRDSELPTIAAVNGAAIGAGLNLALACDVRVAAESATFESRFLQLPIHPGGGHTWMLNRLVGPQATASLCLFDQPVSGRKAERIGLVLRCVPDEDLLAACQRLCSRLVNSPTPVLGRAIKQTLRVTSATADFDQALRYELARQLDSMRSVEFVKRIGGHR